MLIGQASKPKHLTPSNQQCLDGWTCLLHDTKTPHNMHSVYAIKIKDKIFRSFDPEKTGRIRSKDKSSSSSGYHSLHSSTYRPKRIQIHSCVLSMTMKPHPSAIFISMLELLLCVWKRKNMFIHQASKTWIDTIQSTMFGRRNLLAAWY